MKSRGLIFVGLAVAVSLLESAITGVGITVLKGHRNNWRYSPSPILGLAGFGLLVLVTTDVLARFNLLHRR